jgi:hypothetical protein
MDFINSVITPKWMNVSAGTDVTVEDKKEKELGN